MEASAPATLNIDASSIVAQIASNIQTASVYEIIRTILLAASEGVPVYIQAKLYETKFKPYFDTIGVKVEYVETPTEENSIVIDYDETVRANVAIKIYVDGKVMVKKLPIRYVEDALSKIVEELRGFEVKAWVKIVNVPEPVVKALRRRKK